MKKEYNMPPWLFMIVDLLTIKERNISLCREFDEQQFLEYVGPCFKHSAELLQSAAEFDSQLEVFNLVNLIIDRLADGVKPYAEGLLQLMPTVWQASEGQSLLRIQVCNCLYSYTSPRLGRGS